MSTEHVVDVRTEYGVIVDNTHLGHGHRLAEVSRSRDVAEASAAHYRELEGRPAEVKVRTVMTTNWQSQTNPAPTTHNPDAAALGESEAGDV